MKQGVEPWRDPATFCVRGGGSRKRTLGKPLETMGRKTRGCGIGEARALLPV